MSVNPSPIAGFAGQFFDNNGQPLSGGKIYTYAAGTTTPQATYTSALGVTPHANPIVLDSAGRVPGGEIWLTDGLVYKFVIETSLAVLIGTYDNITGVNSNFVNYTVQEEVITATAGQTVFNLSTINYTPGTNSLSVYIDGVNQYVGDSYLETDSNTVTFTSGLHVGGEVKFTTAIQTTTGAVDASIVSYTAGFAGAVQQTVQTKLEQYVSVADFGAVGDGVTDDAAAIQAALTATENKSLYFPEGNYAVGSALSSGGNNLICVGDVAITYTGAAHIDKVLSMSLAGSPASILGKLTVDGNNKANIGVFVINDSATAVPLTLGDIEGRNCRMVLGSVFNAGSAGVVVRGNFTAVQFDRLWAKDIGRGAGTGSPGNFGTNGVIIDRDGSGRAALVISGNVCGAENITCDDAPGSPGAVDVDGVAFFQNDVSGAACEVGLISAVNVEGRGFKGQNYRATHINQISIVRSVSMTTGGGADVNMQYCEGVVDKCDIVYSGNADTVHGEGTTCVAYFTDVSRADGYGVAPIRNLAVRDNCTSGTATIDFVSNIEYRVVNAEDKFGSVENVILLGRSAKALVNIGNGGSAGYGKLLLKIDGFVGELTDGLIANEAACPDLFAGVSRVWNTGTSVPAIYRTDAVPLGNVFGKIIDNGGNIGVLRYRGTGGLPGLVDDSVNDFTSNSIAAGLSPLIAGDFAQNVTVETDTFGVTSGNGMLVMGCPDFGPPGLYTTTGNTITTIQAATGVTVSSTGSAPAGIDFNVWKSSAGTKLSIKNAAVTTRPFFVLVIG